MTLEQALAYLETTSRVSCPQITCEQAAEIAELMRGLSDQHQVDIAEMVNWKIHAQVLHERDEARGRLDWVIEFCGKHGVGPSESVSQFLERLVADRRATPGQDCDASDYERPGR